MMLSLMGNEIRTAYDGSEGLEAAAAFRPDVILLDIGLPKLNGYDVCRRIREQPWGKGMFIVALTGWYILFAAYNRRRGAEALRWVQSACAGKGRIIDSRWLNSSRLYARLQFPSRNFENARVTMKFRPRPLPVHWLLSRLHKHKETLTFEADLGGSPSFQLEVVRHRWCAHSRGVTARKRDQRDAQPSGREDDHFSEPDDRVPRRQVIGTEQRAEA